MITFRRLGKLGRFGNQLFQYAGTRLYAETNGFEWSFPDWDGTRLFKDVRPWTLDKNLQALTLTTIQLADMQSTNWSERILKPLGKWQRSSMSMLYDHPMDDISLFGYMQDKRSLEILREHRTIVRDWFIFRDDIDTAFREATNKYRPWLGAHLRFGDLVKRGVASNIDNAVEHIEQLLNQRNLFIATDSPDVRERLKGHCPIAPDNPIPGLEVAFDFWMLKESDEFIGSGSTFAWWAAFLSNRDAYWSPPLNNTWHGSVPPIAFTTL